MTPNESFCNLTQKFDLFKKGQKTKGKEISLISPTVTEKPTIWDLTGNYRNSATRSKIEACHAMYQTLDSHEFYKFSKSVEPSSRRTRATDLLKKGPPKKNTATVFYK
jgi:hypothetical protein